MKKKVTLFIDPDYYIVDGYSYTIYGPDDSPPPIPRFLVDQNGATTGVMHVKPICLITGYNPDLLYKTYNPETNTFI